MIGTYLVYLAGDGKEVIEGVFSAMDNVTIQLTEADVVIDNITASAVQEVIIPLTAIKCIIRK